MLTCLGKGERVRAAVEQLDPGQPLECDHVARQRALGDQQCIGRGGEAAVPGDALEGAQGVQRQPAAVGGLLGHVDRSCPDAFKRRPASPVLTRGAPRAKPVLRPADAFFRCGQ